MRDDRPLSFRRRSRASPWVSLLLRVALVFGLIGIALAVHWFDRDGLRDVIDGEISFIDVLYFTMITVTTVGYGDIVPVTDQARLFDTFVLTPIRLFIWLIFLGSAYSFLLTRVWDKWRMKLIERTLSGHVVVVGYGASGSEAVSELIRRGADPGGIVIVDHRPEPLREAEPTGANLLEGDGTRDVVLDAARLARARAVMISTGRDDTAILVALTARRLAPDVPVSVVIRSPDNEAIAREAGADTVINPASFAGLLLAGSTHGQHIADYLSDLAACGGQVRLSERAVTAGEVGRPMSAITTGQGLRLHRAGKAYGFWQPETRRLESGDVLVEVVPNREAERTL